jgi:hypothetical protein
VTVTLSVGELREAIISACDLGGAHGQNLHESKDVLIRIRVESNDTYLPLSRVSVAFVPPGRFALVLTAGGSEGDAEDDGTGQ